MFEHYGTVENINCIDFFKKQNFDDIHSTLTTRITC